LQGDSVGPQDKSLWQILKKERPQTKKQYRSLLGMVNFYRRYIVNCAKIVAPIAELTRNHCLNNVELGEKQENAFEKIKRILSSGPVLKLPDLERNCIVQTDDSNVSIGGCLLQEHDGIKHPVMYASRKLLPREQNYLVGGREALAIVWVVEKFHRFLYGPHFILESDHCPWSIFNHQAQRTHALFDTAWLFSHIDIQSNILQEATMLSGII